MNGVHNRSLLTVSRQRSLKLQQASGISRRHHVGFQWRDEPGFAISDGVGSVRLDEVVDAGGTAADGRFGDFRQLEFGDFRKKSARLRSHPLRMLQVT